MKKKESKRYKKLIDTFKVKKIASLEETIEKVKESSHRKIRRIYRRILKFKSKTKKRRS